MVSRPCPRSSRPVAIKSPPGKSVSSTVEWYRLPPSAASGRSARGLPLRAKPDGSEARAGLRRGLPPLAVGRVRDETVACSTAVESAPVTVPYTAAVANILTNSLLRLLRELRELLAHDFDFRLHLWLRIRPEREIVPVRSNRADRVAGESG